MALLERGEVPAVERAVALHPGVDYSTVDSGFHVDAPRPVLGEERGLETGNVRVAHVHEAALGNPGATAAIVLEHEESCQDAVSQIELLAILLDLRLLHGEPVAALDAESKMQPIRAVHEVLVHDVATCDLGDEAVVEPGNVGGRIVRSVGRRLRGGAPGCEVAVPQRAKGFA